MSGARLSRRISAVRSIACVSDAGRPSTLAAGRADGCASESNHGWASLHAPSVCVTSDPETLTRKSSHTQPQTVQATSENVCGVFISWPPTLESYQRRRKLPHLTGTSIIIYWVALFHERAFVWWRDAGCSRVIWDSTCSGRDCAHPSDRRQFG